MEHGGAFSQTHVSMTKIGLESHLRKIPQPKGMSWFSFNGRIAEKQHEATSINGIDWVAGHRAERIELLTAYQEVFPAALIHQPPRIRRKFILQ